MTSTATPSDILAAIKAVCGDEKSPLVLHEPLFSGNEGDYVKSCIDDGWVSSVGAFVDRFEKDIAAFCGAPHAVVTVNGTCAIHAALTALGVGAGDEVLIPSLSFVATANAVVHAGAIPHFVDVEEISLGIDPRALNAYLKEIAVIKDGQTINKTTNRPIKVLMPVHVFGHPCQMDKLAQIAQEWNLSIVEDATEALGSTAQQTPVGKNHMAVFSFNGNKIITTGGGGAIVTQDEQLHHRIKHLTTTAKQPHKWAFYHDEVAFNYRMPNLNAALGCAQLEKLPEYITAKRALAKKYIDIFSKLSGVTIMQEPENTRSNYWLVTLLADTATDTWLEETLTHLHEHKVFCRPIWQPIHTLPMYSKNPSAPLPRTTDLAKRIINLPSSVCLGQKYV